MNRFVEDSNKVRERSDKGKFQNISSREISLEKRALSKILIQQVLTKDSSCPIKIQKWTMQDLKEHGESCKANN